MSSTGGIVTLQFGNYSNYVGAHFWNLEDELVVFDDTKTGAPPEINPSILYRRTESAKVTSYLPRVVCFDLAGSLGSFTELGTFHPDLEFQNTFSATAASASAAATTFGARSAPGKLSTPLAAGKSKSGGGQQLTWNGQVQMHSAERISKNPYLAGLEEEDAAMAAAAAADSKGDVKGMGGGATAAAGTAAPVTAAAAKPFELDGNVKYWTDYYKTHLHHKNLSLLTGVHHDVNAFDYFTQGITYMENADRREDMLDRARYFAEECDSLQGFQCIVDIDSGFGGIASEYLKEIADEYPKRCVFTFGVVPYRNPAKEKAIVFQRRAINEALAMAKLREFSTIYVPTSSQHLKAEMFPKLLFDITQPFHTSAILAAPIHTISASYRKSKDHFDMSALASHLVPTSSQNVFALTVNYPLSGELPVFAQTGNSSNTDSRISGTAASVAAAAVAAAARDMKAERLKSGGDGIPTLTTHGSGGSTNNSNAAAGTASGGTALTEPFHCASYMSSLTPLTSTAPASATVSSTSASAVAASAVTATATAKAHANDRLLSEYNVLRGSKLLLPSKEQESKSTAMYDRFLAHVPNSRIRRSAYIANPLAVPIPYPHFFRSDSKEEVIRAPVLASLHATKRMARGLELLATEFDRVPVSVLTQYRKEGGGYSDDDWSDISNTLRELVDEYKD